jgi:hypothetical protein
MGEVKAALSVYGKVLDMKFEVYGEKSGLAGLLTGVRLVRMEPERHVPNFVKMGGCEAYVEYFGQPKTCSICGATTHLRAACDQRGTYANRLRAPRNQASEGTVQGDQGKGGTTASARSSDDTGESTSTEATGAESAGVSEGDCRAEREEGQERAPEEVDATGSTAPQGTFASILRAEPSKVKPIRCVVDASTLADGWVYEPGTDADSEGEVVLTPNTEAAIDAMEGWETAKVRSTRQRSNIRLGNGSRLPVTRQQKLAKLINNPKVSVAAIKRTLSGLNEDSMNPEKKATKTSAKC